MRPYKIIYIVILLIIAIQTIAFAAVSSEASDLASFDLSLGLPPMVSTRLWLNRQHGLEFGDMGGYFPYLRYMYRFNESDYLGIGYSWGYYFGTIGKEIYLYNDLLVMDFGLVYVPPARNIASWWSNSILPFMQIGARFKF